MRRARYLPRSSAPLAVKADSLGLFFEAPEPKEPFCLEADGAVAVVEIQGPICQRPGWFWDSYEEIEARVSAALASSAKAVVLRIDSPGGDAIGNDECSRSLRASAAAANKRLYAFTDGMAASAAYALACAASTIIVPPAGFVGSIGTLLPVVDVSAADAMYGEKYTLIKSGARKTDGNPHQALTKEAEAELQARVDSLANLFFELVAEARPGVTVEHVRGLEARMYHGDAAVKVGLADQVLNWKQALALAAGGGTATEGDKAMKILAMDTEKKAAAMKAIREAYGDDKDGAEKAIKSAFPDEGEDKDKKPEGDKKDEKAKAEADDQKKKDEEAAKAKSAEDDKKKEEAKALAARASAGDAKASAELAFRVLEDNQKLRAEMAAKDEAIERRDLLAKRPDFGTEILSTLAGMPIEKVREAVEKWPRVGPVKLTPPAAISAMGTRGGATGGDPEIEATAEEKDFIARKMGGAPLGQGIVSRGSVLELGHMTKEQATAHLEKMKKAEAGQKGAA